MKTTILKYSIYSLFGVLITITGCKKEDSFLATKPNQALAIPTSLNDLQLLLNDEDVFNRFYPALGEASTDDMILSPSDWLSDYPSDKNAYVWAKDIYPPGLDVVDWSHPYQMVYYANTILNFLPTFKISTSQQVQSNMIKGSALFFRAIAFYNLVQHFAMPYDSTTSNKDLGVPLPLTPDLTAKLSRATESQCYTQIITDLNSAATLLPDVPARKTLPSKAAVFGLLSRIYLGMGNYNQSLSYATQCLGLYNQLQDFNNLNPAAFPVFPNFSPEEIFHASLSAYNTTSPTSVVDTNLYRSFSNPNDLRPAIFFYNYHGKIEFNSQLDVHNNISSPISTSEIYLTKAECEARMNNMAAAMNDLNTFLITRWKKGTFKPYTAVSADDALNQILKERQKELVMSGVRWLDLRRLNKDVRFAITLKRNISGTIYSIAPNDPRYALPIPENEISINQIPQNNR